LPPIGRSQQSTFLDDIEEDIEEDAISVESHYVHGSLAPVNRSHLSGYTCLDDLDFLGEEDAIPEERRDCSPRPIHKNPKPNEGAIALSTTLLQDPAGPAGQLYHGRVEDGMKHGQGILHFDVAGNGRLVYQGEFFENKKHGQGTMAWPGGRQYVGQFLNDNFHGHGKMIWPDGNKYIGQYANGKKNGQGIWFTPDGSQLSGKFFEGKRHGEFDYARADGTTWVIHFDMDRVIEANADGGSLGAQLAPSGKNLPAEQLPGKNKQLALKETDSLTTSRSNCIMTHAALGMRAVERWRVIDRGGAVVRATVSLKSKKVGVLRQTEELTVVEVRGRRLRVVSPVIGWVSSSTEEDLQIMVRVDDKDLFL